MGTVDASALERIAESIAAAFRASRAARLHERAAEQAGVPRLDRTAFVILRKVEQQPLRVSELADRLGLDVSTVSRKVAGLEQLGLIARTGDRDDRRAALLSLAPAGSRVLKRLRREWLRAVEELVGDWSEQDRLAFADLLERFASGMDAQVREGGRRVADRAPVEVADNYRWIALSNTTLGVLLATLDASITLIAMPAIFRGIRLDPLLPGNSFYLLWMILGYLVVSSVLVVSLGRLGDIFGRVRMYNLGFVIYTAASLMLTIDWMTGTHGAIWLITFRIVQGVGAAFLLANAAAILTDAFPSHQRGLALGLNNVVGVSGQFIGLVLGGLLAPISWRLVFLISVPVGLFGTVWAYLMLREIGVHTRQPIDWLGNLTFGGGLVLVMVGVTYGIQPYGGSPMGWQSPMVLGCLAAGVLLLVAFAVIETRVPYPMFKLSLWRLRPFTFGTLSTFLSSIARGGLMFMLIIWLQGIWLPLHGYSFEQTPLWAGIYMLPLTTGIMVAGPISGVLSDRFGARPFATGGMLGSALAFLLLWRLPTDFAYPEFAAILFLMGVSMGVFASPNRAGVMNSLPAADRGAGGGMNQTLQNSAQVLSIGIFFSLMISGLAATLPHALTTNLQAHGVSHAVAAHAAGLPPVSVLFAAFLGYNPIQHLIGAHAFAQLPHATAVALSSRTTFPSLISAAFRHGLHEAFAFAVVACLVAAAASWSRGTRYVADAEPSAVAAPAAEPGRGRRPERSRPARRAGVARTPRPQEDEQGTGD